MPRTWMFAAGVATVFAVGGAVYYFFPKPVASPISAHGNDVNLGEKGRMIVAPIGNPLISADSQQFGRWVPSYPVRCGEILYESINPEQRSASLCIAEVSKRVASYTDVQLSVADVVDPRVKARWLEIMKGK